MVSRGGQQSNQGYGKPGWPRWLCRWPGAVTTVAIRVVALDTPSSLPLRQPVRSLRSTRGVMPVHLMPVASPRSALPPISAATIPTRSSGSVLASPLPAAINIKIYRRTSCHVRGRKPPVKPFKKKPNPLKAAKVTEIDYKDVALLRKFISDRGKIRSRRITGVTVQEQRELSKAIQNAREMALLPYATSGR